MAVVNRKPFNIVAIAGTFDRLHKGHRFFICEAFKFGEKVIIGLTSDDFANEKLKIKNEKLQFKIKNYEERERELEGYLKRKKLFDRAQIVKIDDVYGPTIEETKIEALVVTRETLGGARLVNKKRKYKGLKSLKILKIPLIPAEDKKRISSTRIRLGEIDRWGRVYLKKFIVHSSEFRVKEEIRQNLKKPLGELLKGDPDNLLRIADTLKKRITEIQPVMVITVGDEVTKLCNEIGIKIDLAVIDYKVRRKAKYHSLSDLGFKSTFSRAALANGVRTVRNPAGHIKKSLVKSVKISYLNFIKSGRQKIIRVLGEEDLAGVPAVLLSPLGSVVLYGQPGEGVVVVEVTEESKKKLLSLINL